MKCTRKVDTMILQLVPSKKNCNQIFVFKVEKIFCVVWHCNNMWQDHVAQNNIFLGILYNRNINIEYYPQQRMSAEICCVNQRWRLWERWWKAIIEAGLWVMKIFSASKSVAANDRVILFSDAAIKYNVQTKTSQCPWLFFCPSG